LSPRALIQSEYVYIADDLPLCNGPLMIEDSHFDVPFIPTTFSARLSQGIANPSSTSGVIGPVLRSKCAYLVLVPPNPRRRLMCLITGLTHCVGNAHLSWETAYPTIDVQA
jgi:hypothetical protein